VRFDAHSWAVAATALALASLAGFTAINAENEADAANKKDASGSSSNQAVTSCEPRRMNSAVATQPRNVMLHSMRSVKGRGLNKKYEVEWDTVLGEGAYGYVHPARLAVTGEKVALKKISRRYTDSSAFMNEIDALLRIYDNGGHPNISGLRDTYEDQKYYYLILDLVTGGEMFEHLINFGAYSEADAARLMHEIASALAFLHGVGLIHADLKPENLLLSTKNRLDGTIKIIDFGCAVVDHENVEDTHQDAYAIQAKKRKDLLKSASSTGTTAYWPPERFDMDSTADAGTDMWAIGVILYIMLTGVHPFDVDGVSTDEDIKERIKADPRPPMTDDLVGHLSESALDLILKLMETDPKKRLTAYDMLQHPWVRGETASKERMQDSDKKLSRFKDLRYKLEASMFSVLVSQGYSDARLSEAKVSKKKSVREDSSAHIMKRAFDIFDAEGKGFVTSGDLGRVASERTGSVVSSSDTEEFLATRGDGSSSANNLSLSQFNKIFSGLHQKHYPRGHYIFHAGEPGDAMYFLSSGKVEIQTRKGQLVSLLRSGDFFGEGSLLEKGSTRYTSAKCATPVDLYEIKRDDFDRYMGASETARMDLRVKWRSRSLVYAKNLLRLQENVRVLELKKGDVVYKEGDLGTSMFRVDDDDDERGGELAVSHGDNIVHKYVQGDSFGESSLLFKRPRSSTVTCVSDACRLHVMNGADFLAVIDSSPEMAESLRNMCRKRLFKRAVKAYSLEKKRGLSDDDIVAAFHDADIDRSGSLSLEEVRRLMHQMDPNFPMEEIQALLTFVDINEDGQMTLEEFKRLFRQFEDEKVSV
jgi:serine/threonine protein kinase